MRILPLLAVVVASAGLAACSNNTAPPARSPDVVVQPAPSAVVTPAPSSTVVVPRAY